MDKMVPQETTVQMEVRSSHTEKQPKYLELL